MNSCSWWNKAGIDIDHTSDFHQPSKDSRFLGDDDFMEQAYAKSGETNAAPPKLSRIIDHICRKYELEESDLTSSLKGHKPSEARAFIALFAKETGAATLTEVAEQFNRDIATISGAVSHIRKRSLIDDEFNSRSNILFAEFASIRNKDNRTEA